MNILVFDTETTSLDKPFCYNIGYIIFNTDTNTTLLKKDFVVEQIWHNMELFTSAYYANKRPIYVNRMRTRKTKMLKYGYICQEMARDIKNFEVVAGYAYNSSFDEKVFNFNSDWYKCVNPIELLPIFDIRGYVHNSVVEKQEFKDFCEKHNRFTESGNYSTTAETIFQFMTGNTEFAEEHTALADSVIEGEILYNIVKYDGLKWNTEYKTKFSITRDIERTLTIKQNDTETTYKYHKMTKRKNTIILK